MRDRFGGVEPGSERDETRPEELANPLVLTARELLERGFQGARPCRCGGFHDSPLPYAATGSDAGTPAGLAIARGELGGKSIQSATT